MQIVRFFCLTGIHDIGYVAQPCGCISGCCEKSACYSPLHDMIQSHPPVDLVDMDTPTSVQPLLNQCQQYLSEQEVAQVVVAFEFAQDAHDGQKRKSGEDYIWHPVEVTRLLAKLELNVDTLIAGLLHDVVEDTPVTLDEVAQRFGTSVATLVNGVTKLDALKNVNAQEKQAQNVQKMLLSMANDIRIIFIKLADRLHNMRTLGSMRREKQMEKAHETIDIYAPLAGKLGLNAFRIELEDLGFKALNPKRYQVLKAGLQKATGQRKEAVKLITEALEKRLADTTLPRFDVSGRQKHLYSLYKKMKYKKRNLQDVLDILAFRILVYSPDDCYRTLGFIHATYKPVPGRFKDYIALPKSNGYQSLHTVVIGPWGQRVEIQIRTFEMHQVAEHGLAAHCDYKNEGVNSTGSDIGLKQTDSWLRHLLDMQQSVGNSIDFLSNVKNDLMPGQAYVFTPEGKMITLPKGATALDFAYAVHSDIGKSALACRINGDWRPLQSKLKTGQSVDIIRSEQAKPSPKQLEFVFTSRAKSRILHYLKHQTTDEAVELGRKLLSKELSNHNLDCKQLANHQQDLIGDRFDVESWPGLLAEVGKGLRSPTIVAHQIAQFLMDSSEKAVHTPDSSIVGAEGISLTYAQCCHPIPGDHIMGHFSRGKGLVIHRSDCQNLKHAQDLVNFEWSTKASDAGYLVGMQVSMKNKQGALADISKQIYQKEANIEQVNMVDKDGVLATLSFELRVKDRVHLANIFRAVRACPPVVKVERR